MPRCDRLKMATFPRYIDVRGTSGMASASDSPSKNVRFTPETPRNISEGYRGTIDPERTFGPPQHLLLTRHGCRTGHHHLQAAEAFANLPDERVALKSVCDR